MLFRVTVVGEGGGWRSSVALLRSGMVPVAKSVGWHAIAPVAVVRRRGLHVVLLPVRSGLGMGMSVSTVLDVGGRRVPSSPAVAAVTVDRGLTVRTRSIVIVLRRAVMPITTVRNVVMGLRVVIGHGGDQSERGREDVHLIVYIFLNQEPL